MEKITKIEGKRFEKGENGENLLRNKVERWKCLSKKEDECPGHCFKKIWQRNSPSKIENKKHIQFYSSQIYCLVEFHT